MLLSEIKIIKNLFKDKIKGVIHVGAHDGSCIDVYKKLGITSIYLFEPNIDLIKKVKKKIFYYNLFNMNVVLKNFALSNYCGKSIFYVNSNDQASSLLELHKHKDIYKNNIVIKKKIVRVKTLDYFLKEEIKNYNFLNIDAQGSELNILKGSKYILRYIDIIYCEVNFDYLYKKSCLVSEIDFFLKKYNFKRVYTVTNYHPSWGDAIYIKNNLEYDFKKIIK